MRVTIARSVSVARLTPALKKLVHTRMYVCTHMDSVTAIFQADPGQPVVLSQVFVGDCSITRMNPEKIGTYQDRTEGDREETAKGWDETR